MEERDTNSISHFITSGNWQVDVPSPISNYDYRQEVQSCSSNLKSSNVTILHSPVNETRTVRRFTEYLLFVMTLEFLRKVDTE